MKVKLNDRLPQIRKREGQRARPVEAQTTKSAARRRGRKALGTAWTRRSKTTAESKFGLARRNAGLLESRADPFCGGPTLRSNGKCSNENAKMDNHLMEYDLIG